MLSRCEKSAQKYSGQGTELPSVSLAKKNPEQDGPVVVVQWIEDCFD